MKWNVDCESACLRAGKKRGKRTCEGYPQGEEG